MRADRMLIGISSSDVAWLHPRWPGAKQEMILFVENNKKEEERMKKEMTH